MCVLARATSFVGCECACKAKVLSTETNDYKSYTMLCVQKCGCSVCDKFGFVNFSVPSGDNDDDDDDDENNSDGNGNGSGNDAVAIVAVICGIFML